MVSCDVVSFGPLKLLKDFEIIVKFQWHRLQLKVRKEIFKLDQYTSNNQKFNGRENQQADSFQRRQERLGRGDRQDIVGYCEAHVHQKEGVHLHHGAA